MGLLSPSTLDLQAQNATLRETVRELTEQLGRANDRIVALTQRLEYQVQRCEALRSMLRDRGGD